MIFPFSISSNGFEKGSPILSLCKSTRACSYTIWMCWPVSTKHQTCIIAWCWPPVSVLLANFSLSTDVSENTNQYSSRNTYNLRSNLNLHAQVALCIVRFDHPQTASKHTTSCRTLHFAHMRKSEGSPDSWSFSKLPCKSTMLLNGTQIHKIYVRVLKPIP